MRRDLRTQLRTRLARAVRLRLVDAEQVVEPTGLPGVQQSWHLRTTGGDRMGPLSGPELDLYLTGLAHGAWCRDNPELVAYTLELWVSAARRSTEPRAVEQLVGQLLAASGEAAATADLGGPDLADWQRVATWLAQVATASRLRGAGGGR